MIMLRPALVLALLVCTAAPAPLRAQRPADIVRWTVAAPATPVVAGRSLPLEMTAAIQEGWHLYALTQPEGGPNPLKIALAAGSPFTLDVKGIKAPAPEVVKDANFNLETRQHDGSVIFRVPVRAAREASAGPHTLTFEITFQACGNGICLRPYTARVPVEVRVAR